jgi:hypothetical protein
MIEKIKDLSRNPTQIILKNIPKTFQTSEYPKNNNNSEGNNSNNFNQKIPESNKFWFKFEWKRISQEYEVYNNVVNDRETVRLCRRKKDSKDVAIKLF